MNKRFSSPGIKKIYGYLFFDNNGNTDSLLVDTQFYVIPKPNEAIVSPVNMQVFYIGLRNEIAVAFPGIADLTSIRVDGKNGTILKSSILLFFISNFGVWLLGYPNTLAGFIGCYTLALPFLINTIIGDFFFYHVLNFSFSKIEQRYPVLAS